MVISGGTEVVCSFMCAEQKPMIRGVVREEWGWCGEGGMKATNVRRCEGERVWRRAVRVEDVLRRSWCSSLTRGVSRWWG